MKKYCLAILCSIAAMFPSQEMHASISNTTAALIGFSTSALAASGTAYYFNKQIKEKEWQIQKQETILKCDKFWDEEIVFGTEIKRHFELQTGPYHINIFLITKNWLEEHEEAKKIVLQNDEELKDKELLILSTVLTGSEEYAEKYIVAGDDDDDFFAMKAKFMRFIARAIDALK